MNTRRIVQASALAVMLVLLGIVIWQRTGRSAGVSQHGVGLRNGQQLYGSLLELERGSLLCQTESKCLILSPEDIRTVDGRAMSAPDVPVAARVERTQETFEVIGPGGEIELHSRQSRVNPGSEIIANLDWGLGPREVPLLDHYRVVDQLGNELPLRVEPEPRTNGKRVHVTLPRPVLPGESMEITTIIGNWSRVERDGDVWLYRMRGDYPDDRLVTRSVLLPTGARILSISPEPLHSVRVGEQKLVVWRRYFRAAEVQPWEIRYRL
jgi:hypothetical protein